MDPLDSTIFNILKNPLLNSYLLLYMRARVLLNSWN